VSKSNTNGRRYGGHGTFDERNADGAVAERAVARWLEAHGRRVTILAHVPPGQRGAPMLHGLEGSVVAPDLLAVHPRTGRGLLVEVKAKSCGSWHHLTKCWTSGITAKELDRYQEAEKRTGLQCWLAIVQAGKGDRVVPKAPPPPAGLLVAPVKGLEAHANHSFGRGDDARIYWCLARPPWCHLAPLDALDFGP
jgi:hypothetical protein